MRGLVGPRPTVQDPELGVLHRRRGRWRGEVRLPATAAGPAGALPVSVPGSRRAPSPEALVVARRVAVELERCATTIEAALDEHRRDCGIPPLVGTVEPVPLGLAVITLERRLVLELAYRVPWDDEHTLGARFVDGELIELNGSILLP